MPPRHQSCQGLLLIVAGAYVTWYVWYEIRVLRDPDTTDPIIDAATIGSTIAGWVVKFEAGGISVAFVLPASAAGLSTLIKARR